MAGIFGLGSLDTSGGTEKLVALKDRHFWVWNSSNSNWELQTGAGKYLTASTVTYHEEFLDHQFWVNGVDGNRTYNGSSWSATTNISDSPIGTYIKLFDVRLYLGNLQLQVPNNANLSFASRIWYSNLPEQDANGNWRISWDYEAGRDLVSDGTNDVTSASATFVTNGIQVGDPLYIISGANTGKYRVRAVVDETSLTLTEDVTTLTGQKYWVGGNWLDLDFDDGDVITGLSENFSRLLIFKQNSLHVWDGRGSDKIKGVPGTTSQRSVASVRDATYYFHPTGIWRFNGVTAELISEPIWDVIEAISSSNYANVVAWTDNARFVKFYVGNTSANLATDLPAITNCVLVYDLTLDAWSLMSLAHTVSVTAPWIESSAHKIYAGFSDGHVYQLETGNSFDGTDIPFRLRTKTYYPVAPQVTINGTRIEEFANAGQNLQIGYRRIKQPYPDDKEFRPIGGAFSVAEREFRGLQFEMTESSSNPSFLLEGLTVYYDGAKIER